MRNCTHLKQLRRKDMQWASKEASREKGLRCATYETLGHIVEVDARQTGAQQAQRMRWPGRESGRTTRCFVWSCTRCFVWSVSGALDEWQMWRKDHLRATHHRLQTAAQTMRLRQRLQRRVRPGHKENHRD